MNRSLVYLALLSGCFIKPNRVDPGDGGGGGDDGNGSGKHDAAVDAPVNPTFKPNVVANVHYSDTSATGSNGQGFYYIAVPANSIHQGDLLLIIGNVDNNPVWNLPDSSWHQERSVFFGNDGQTFVVFSKFATSSEPDHYGGNIMAVQSGAFTATLLDIPKAGAIALQHRTASTGENPVHNIADPVTITVPNTMVIFAAGADWLASTNSFSTTPPDGYTPLASFGDTDNQDFWWTTQQIAYAYYATAQTTPTLTGTTTSNNIAGQSWALTIAIEPQ